MDGRQWINVGHYKANYNINKSKEMKNFRNTSTWLSLTYEKFFGSTLNREQNNDNTKNTYQTNTLKQMNWMRYGPMSADDFEHYKIINL